jgi:secretion/DNA translocation related TadE-like protein
VTASSRDNARARDSRFRGSARCHIDRGSLSGRLDRGSASVVMVAVIGVVVATTAGALVLAGVVRASHQARLGADLGAVAGAVRLRDGASASVSCAEAGRIASANGTSLQACSVSGSEVTVVVAASSSTWPRLATARARAGPETSRS